MGAENQGSVCARKRGCTSNIIHRLLRWLNYTVIAASIITIICMLALRIVPTSWGWGFLSFSFVSIASAIVGCISTSSGSCYSVHMFLLITSACSQCSVFLFVITRPDVVLVKFQSNRSEYDGRVLLKVDAALLLWVFCVQMVVMAMSCIVHHCEPADYYEDLEGNARAARGSSRRLSRVQEESIADAQAEEATQKDRKGSKLASEASRLHREMKEKYSKKEEEAYDNVDI